MEVIRTVFSAALEKGFEIRDLDFSPIRGPEGNIEYLVHLVKAEQDAAGMEEERFAELIRETVSSAHRTLDV